MDLDRYFDRIAYCGSRDVSLATLADIVLAHACAIPFENLDVLLNRPISLDDNDVERKLVRERRGGYCFEQNSLLMRVLTTLGFVVSPLSARVWLQSESDQTPRTHIFLRVDLECVPWLADIGVGGESVTGPLRLDRFDIEQSTPHGARRIICKERSPFPHYVQQTRWGDKWVDVYEFTLEEMPLIDQEVANYYVSTHPNSKFRRNLLVAIGGRDGTRLAIKNREFTRRRGSEVLESCDIASPEELLRLLDQHFGLSFATGTRFECPNLVWPECGTMSSR